MIEWITARVGAVGAKVIAVGLATVAVVVLVWLAWHHYTGLLSSVEQLKVEKSQLTAVVEQQKLTVEAQGSAIQEWKASQERLSADVGRLAAVATTAREEARRANDILSKHDAAALAAKHPRMVERRINGGTADAMRLLECSSGNRSSCGSAGGKAAGGKASRP